MNILARAWAERERDRLALIELRRLAREANEAQDQLRPVLAGARARRQERMRTEGPTGFVMIERSP